MGYMTNIEELVEAIRKNDNISKEAKSLIAWSNNGIVEKKYKDYVEVIYNSLDYNSSIIARFMGWSIKPKDFNEDKVIRLIRKGNLIDIFADKTQDTCNSFEAKASIILAEIIAGLANNKDFLLNLKHIVPLIYDFKPYDVKIQDVAAMLSNLLIKMPLEDIITIFNNSNTECNNLLFDFGNDLSKMPEAWYKLLIEALKTRLYCSSEIELINKFKENNFKYNSIDCFKFLIKNNHFFDAETLFKIDNNS